MLFYSFHFISFILCFVNIAFWSNHWSHCNSCGLTILITVWYRPHLQYLDQLHTPVVAPQHPVDPGMQQMIMQSHQLDCMQWHLHHFAAILIRLLSVNYPNNNNNEFVKFCICMWLLQNMSKKIWVIQTRITCMTSVSIIVGKLSRWAMEVVDNLRATESCKSCI